MSRRALMLPLLWGTAHAAPSPPPLLIDVLGGALAGQTATVRVQGATPNARVYLGGSVRRAGTPFCPPSISPTCMELQPPVTALVSARADAAGVALLTLPIPAALEGRRPWVQAVLPTLAGAELSPPLQLDILSALGDEDGDGLSNEDEVGVYGTDPRVPDTDGGGADDGEEVMNGTNPNDPSDDVLPVRPDLVSVSGTVTVDLELTGSLASTLCSSGLILQCSCTVTYAMSGDLIDVDAVVNTYDGTFERLVDTCIPISPGDPETLASVVWEPNDGTAFHTMTFDASGNTLEQWVAHEVAGNATPSSTPVTDEQYWIGFAPAVTVDPVDDTVFSQELEVFPVDPLVDLMVETTLNLDFDR